MKPKASIKKKDGVETAKICRWCLSPTDALEDLAKDDSGQYKVQKIFDFTGLQMTFLPAFPSYLCTMCEARLKKIDGFRWRCNRNSDLVDKFIGEQNTAKNESEITQEHLDHSGEQTVGTELSIETEVTSPDETNDLPLTQKCCTAHQANRIYECCGNQPLEAEGSPITIKLEYVGVDELFWLQTNAILDHEQDDLQKNPSELVCQDREDHSMPKNMCADGTELLTKTEVTSRDTAKHLHLNQKCFNVHQANSTYECCGKIPDDLFEAEENPIAIKSEYEEVEEQDNIETNTLQSQSIEIGIVGKDAKGHKRINTDMLSSTDVKRRLMNQNETRLVCETCDKTFRSRKTLKDHTKIHREREYHHCTISGCSSKFVRLPQLLEHIRTHNGERPFQCKVCNKAFRTSGTLTEHSKIHNKDQQHQCPHCSSKFPWLSHLKIHIRTHTGERPYQCKVCDKAFHSSRTLGKHSKLHNKDQQHKCPQCPSMFVELFQLKVHIRSHTGERPFQCKVCAKAFRSTGSLTEHLRIHYKDQQLQCPHCPAMFAQSSNLKYHLRTHMHGKPYKRKSVTKESPAVLLC